jgi:hypothetical protein
MGKNLLEKLQESEKIGKNLHFYKINNKIMMGRELK